MHLTLLAFLISQLLHTYTCLENTVIHLKTFFSLTSSEPLKQISRYEGGLQSQRAHYLDQEVFIKEEQIISYLVQTSMNYPRVK